MSNNGLMVNIPTEVDEILGSKIRITKLMNWKQTRTIIYFAVSTINKY
jgi:hypothetical protein